MDSIEYRVKLLELYKEYGNKGKATVSLSLQPRSFQPNEKEGKVGDVYALGTCFRLPSGELCLYGAASVSQSRNGISVTSIAVYNTNGDAGVLFLHGIKLDDEIKNMLIESNINTSRVVTQLPTASIVAAALAKLALKNSPEEIFEQEEFLVRCDSTGSNVQVVNKNPNANLGITLPPYHLLISLFDIIDNVSNIQDVNIELGDGSIRATRITNIQPLVAFDTDTGTLSKIEILKSAKVKFVI